MTPTSYTYIGKGKVGLQDRIALTGHRYIGGTSSLTLSIESEEKTIPNFETPGGGNLNKITRITKMSGELVLQELQAKNLALALRALVSEETSGSVAAEAHTAFNGAIIPLDYLLDKTAAVTPVIAVSAGHVTTTAYSVGETILATGIVYQCTTAGTSGGSAPTFNTTLGSTTTDGTVVWTSRGAVTMVDGTDYQAGNSAIEIPNSATRFALGLPITIAYTKNAAYLVQLLTDSQRDYELVFDGLNEADSGIAAPSRLYKVRFDPTSGLSLKADDFASLTLAFEVLPDTTKVGTAISQYGNFRIAK
jgi:hypothetical protein